jgi:hypothetical protein
MLQTGKSIKLKALNAPQDRDKDQFIMGLHSFFCAGDVVLVGGRAQHTQLISQILNFPSGKKDIINALAYSSRVFSGEAIYSDFSDANITSGYELGRGEKLLLACNSDSAVTTAVLCAINAQYLTVLADWVSPLLPIDVIPDITKLIRVSYPGFPVTSWVPADIFDMVGRNPLVLALKSAKIAPHRAEYAVMSRGALSPMIRTTMRGRRLFMVDANARDTLQALSLGYNFPSKSTGETTKEPERNASKTLMEALEALTFYMNKIESQVEYTSNATNATGVPYRSALSKSK